MISFNRLTEQNEMFAKTIWMNPAIEYVIRQNIVEYDMQSASLSVARRFHLIPEERLEILTRMPKEKRTKEVGLMQKYDKELSDNIINGILQTRKEFIQANQLTENHIVTLHSDALMFIQNKVINDKIHGVPFIQKHAWTSYLRYGRIEIFYSDGTIDYKNIPKPMVQQHTLGLNQYLLKVFRMLEDNDFDIFEYLSKFQRLYLQDKLDEYYYIPFGNTGKYKLENMKLLSMIAKIAINEVR